MENLKSKSQYQTLAEKMCALAKKLGQTEVVKVIDALSKHIFKDTISCAVIEVKPGLFSDISATLFPDFFSQDVRNSDAEWKIPVNKNGTISKRSPCTCFRTPDIRDWKEFCRNSTLWRKLIEADVVLFIIDSRLKPSAEERIKYLNFVFDSRLFFLQSNSALPQAEKMAEDNKKLLSGWFSMKKEDLHYFRLYPDDELKKFKHSIKKITLVKSASRNKCLLRQIIFSGTYLLT